MVLQLAEHQELLRYLADATTDVCCGDKQSNVNALQLCLSHVVGHVHDLSVTLPLSPGVIVTLSNVLCDNQKYIVVSNSDAHAAVCAATPLSIRCLPGRARVFQVHSDSHQHNTITIPLRNSKAEHPAGGVVSMCIPLLAGACEEMLRCLLQLSCHNSNTSRNLIDAWFAHSSAARRAGLFTVTYQLGKQASHETYVCANTPKHTRAPKHMHSGIPPHHTHSLLSNVLLLTSMMTPYLTSKAQQPLLEIAATEGFVSNQSPCALEYEQGVGFVLMSDTASAMDGMEEQNQTAGGMLVPPILMRAYRTSSNGSTGSNPVVHDDGTAAGSDVDMDEHVHEKAMQEEKGHVTRTSCREEYQQTHGMHKDDDDDEQDDACSGSRRHTSSGQHAPSQTNAHQSSEHGTSSQMDNAADGKQTKQQDAQEATAQELAMFAQNPWTLNYMSMDTEMRYVAHLLSFNTTARRMGNSMISLVMCLFILFCHPFKIFYASQWCARGIIALNVAAFSIDFLPSGWPRLPSVRPYGFFLQTFLGCGHPFIHVWATWYGIDASAVFKSTLYTFQPTTVFPYLMNGSSQQGTRFVLALAHAILSTIALCTVVLPTLCAHDFATYPWALPIGVLAVCSMAVVAVRCKYVGECRHRAQWQAQELAVRR